MIKVFEYMYYSAYLFGARLNSKRSKEWISAYHERAWLVLSSTIFSLCMTCFSFFTIVFSPNQVKPYTNILVAVIVLSGVLSLGSTYYYLFYKKNSERIIDSYSKNRGSKIMLDLIVGFLYFILSTFSLPAALFFIDYFHLGKS